MKITNADNDFNIKILKFNLGQISAVDNLPVLMGCMKDVGSDFLTAAEKDTKSNEVREVTVTFNG